MTKVMCFTVALVHKMLPVWTSIRSFNAPLFATWNGEDFNALEEGDCKMKGAWVPESLWKSALNILDFIEGYLLFFKPLRFRIYLL